MDNSPPPIKPPRGIKSPKETSGLLMTVIRTLSSSESNEEREKEKARLEHDYKRSDQQLNDLVSLHNEDLTQVMQLFSKLSLTVLNARDKLRFIKESLQGCKSLLSCRRDELKKLWLEGVEQKHILDLLEKIEQLKEVPGKLDSHIATREYLLGTKLLVSALELGDGTLEGVEALRELRSELHLKKEKLYEKLMDELTHHVYTLSADDDRHFVKEVNKRDSLSAETTFNINCLDSSFRSDTEERLENNMGLLVECLMLLNKLNDAVEYIRANMQSELLGVVNKVSRTLVSYPNEGIHPLLDLFNHLTRNLKKIAELHSEVLHFFMESSKSATPAVTLYETSDVWSAIQTVLQHLLTDYLDIPNTATESQHRPSYTERTIFISSYFNRRKTRPQKPSLFKFENSSLTCMYSGSEGMSSTMALSSYSGSKPERLLVCSPDPNNITVIFSSLIKFVNEIEEVLNLPNGSPCSLNIFITDYVQRVYLARELTRVCVKVESATKTSDAWCRPISPTTMSENGLVTPILQSTLNVSLCLTEMESLLETLYQHSNQILSIIVGLIKIYSETCNAAYRGIVQPEPEDKRLCSAAWLKDEDINRFLKSLPNWMDLQARKSVYRSKKGLKREDTVEEESPEDIRQRNIKEAEILASNLGESGISSHEIISDPSHLKSLALMQESMEWFASRIHQVIRKAKKIPSSNCNNGHTDNFTQSLNSLQSFSVEFEELANTCLLVLHLEVRVQCFHYLLPKGNVTRRSNKNAQELDPKILDLSRVLLSVDDALSCCLQPRKTKYIFEGLGHLIAKILMSITQYIERIDEVAIQKMCRNIFTLQQTITNITVTREVALDHARNYFQLFFVSPEDILNKVLEKGPEFSELEYMNALQLINRSFDNQDQTLVQKHLQKLSDILGEVGVTV